jgi:hypothetical protein
MLELYIVTFSSANYAGAPEYCSVWADSVSSAENNLNVLEYAENFYYEQDSEQYIDDNGEDAECYSVIKEAVALAGSEFEEYYANKDQRDSFYPCVNKEEAPV